MLAVSQNEAVTGLYPGQATTFAVTVRNKSRKPVRLRTVGAQLQGAVPGCPSSAVRLGSVRITKILKPRRSTVVRLPVALERSAPDGCQGRHLALTLTASGKTTR